MSELIGRKLGQYEITALLGEGGMATVYRAHQESMGRDVAIKIIESKLACNPEFSKRFDREARTIAALSHSHILKVFDYGRQDDLIYLVMELLPGGSLTDLIKRKPLDLPDAVRLLDQVGDALDYAHGLGIIHRDLKPQNVLLDARGNAILTDFGIAKLLNETTALTHSGIAMGTPFYMSPEQCQGGTIDARSDLYALGIMLFEMLTGDVPFKSDTPISLLYMHINQAPPSVRQNRPDLPEAVELVIRKALAKQPAARFQSAGEMVAAFRTAITGVIPAGLEETEPPGERTARTPIPAIPAARVRMPHEETQVQPVQRSGRTMLVLGSLALVVIVGIAVILLSGRGGGEVTPITAAASATAPVIAANPTETAVPVLSSTFTFTATDNPTQTPAPSQTSTFTPTVTDTATETFTSTATDTATLTETSVPSLTPTETLDPIRAAETIYFSGLTLTATQWTLTPSPNFTETVEARLTEMAVAAYTQTPTPSDTPTFTLTPTVTFTSTLTPTVTVTATLTSTFTHTPTSTYTPAYTPTVAPTPAPTLIPAGTSNKVWTPVERDFNGVTMVLVPAGCFMMGSTDVSTYEQPVHEVCFEQPFWIDKYEVTIGQFNDFSGQAAQPSYWKDEDRPREQITWIEAEAFCTKRRIRLPTEAEWEYAVRGPEGLIYPWGNTFVDHNVVYFYNSGNQSAKVGSRPGGVSWVGAYDMSGNIFEWVADRYDEYYYTSSPKINPQGPSSGQYHVLRGGSWINDDSTMRGAGRSRGGDLGSSFMGFRCARSYQ